MAATWRGRNKVAITAAIISLFGFGIYVEELVVQLFRDRAASVAHEATRQSVTVATARFEAELFRNTYLSDSLASFITMDPDLTESRWQSVAGKLFEKSTVLRNVGIAPNDVITHIYPVEGNEKALGLDFRTVPEQMRSVQHARDLQSIYLAGPVDLVQGGSALIARFPIFRDFPINQHYWGTVSVVMQFDTLLEDSGLDNIEAASVALRRPQLDSTGHTVIYGDRTVFDNPDIVLPVNTPSSEWQLAARFDRASSPGLQAAITVIRTVALVVLALIIASILLLLRAYHYSRNAALIDELTRIPNRRYIISRLHRLINGRSRPARFTVLLIDLNRFKAVNDTLGHEAGDALLIHVAGALEEALRAGDTVARLGGDEFIAIVHRVSEKQQVESVIAKIQAYVEGSPLNWHDAEITPSLSIGYAVCRGQDTSVKELLAQADQSMYQSKRSKLQGISPWR